MKTLADALREAPVIPMGEPCPVFLHKCTKHPTGHYPWAPDPLDREPEPLQHFYGHRPGGSA